MGEAENGDEEKEGDEGDDWYGPNGNDAAQAVPNAREATASSAGRGSRNAAAPNAAMGDQGAADPPADNESNQSSSSELFDSDEENEMDGLTLFYYPDEEINTNAVAGFPNDWPTRDDFVLMSNEERKKFILGSYQKWLAHRHPGESYVLTEALLAKKDIEMLSIIYLDGNYKPWAAEVLSKDRAIKPSGTGLPACVDLCAPRPRTLRRWGSVTYSRKTLRRFHVMLTHRGSINSTMSPSEMLLNFVRALHHCTNAMKGLSALLPASNEYQANVISTPQEMPDDVAPYITMMHPQSATDNSLSIEFNVTSSVNLRRLQSWLHPEHRPSNTSFRNTLRACDLTMQVLTSTEDDKVLKYILPGGYVLQSPDRILQDIAWRIASYGDYDVEEMRVVWGYARIPLVETDEGQENTGVDYVGWQLHVSAATANEMRNDGVIALQCVDEESKRHHYNTYMMPIVLVEPTEGHTLVDIANYARLQVARRSHRTIVTVTGLPPKDINELHVAHHLEDYEGQIPEHPIGEELIFNTGGYWTCTKKGNEDSVTMVGHYAGRLWMEIKHDRIDRWEQDSFQRRLEKT